MKLLNKKHTEKQKPLHYILPYNDFLMSFVVYIGLYKGKFDVNSCFLASFVSNWTCTSLWPHCWSANAYWKFVSITVEAAIGSKWNRFYMILGKLFSQIHCPVAKSIHKQNIKIKAYNYAKFRVDILKIFNRNIINTKIYMAFSF